MEKYELIKLLQQEKDLYCEEKRFKCMRKSRHKRYYIWKYLRCFRLCQYYRDLRIGSKASHFKRKTSKVLFKYYEKKKNIYSYKSGVEIGINSVIGCNCNIWHGGVVINGVLGDNCILHGNNIIGNKGIGKEFQVPTIGSNVDIGAGAVIIGEIKIADECVVGACSVVTKSFLTPSSIITGIPGRARPMIEV